MMFKVKVYVTLKQGVLDPQGKAVQNSLQTLGHNGVTDVRVGKYLELTVDSMDNIDERINTICNQLLANPVIEDYRYDIEEVVPQ